MSTTGKPLPGSATAFTLTAASLATSAGLTVGRQSTLVDNTVGLSFDAQIMAKVKLGTTPTANTVLRFYAIGSDGTLVTGGGGTTDAAFTPAPDFSACFYLGSINNLLTTTGQTFTGGPWSLAQAFGGFVPIKFGIVLVHNTGVNLDATGGNFSFTYSPMQTQSV